MNGTPAEKPQNDRRANILLSVDKIKTPLLFCMEKMTHRFPC